MSVVADLYGSAPAAGDEQPWDRVGVKAYVSRVACWSQELGHVRNDEWLSGHQAAHVEGHVLGQLWAAYLGDPS